MSVGPEAPRRDDRLTPPTSAEADLRDDLADDSAMASSAGSTMSKWLPSRPASVAPLEHQRRDDPLSIPPGGRIGEFVIEKTLGRGGFGVVYLARQDSLDRQVALKVVTKKSTCDGEGRSLARLEHDHIVQVYAESIDPPTGALLLCMQYVAGTTLAAIGRGLAPRGAGGWSGADLLAVLDALGVGELQFDPNAMRDREFLQSADHIQAVCRIGEQLARALEHAHVRGVLHRDVKPANVLMNRYGRPLLADFNLAIRENDRDRSSVFGGTLAYMSPEHLEAFDPDSTSPDEAVNERSDLYSLAVVLWELSSGARPYPTPGNPMRKEELSSILKEQAQQRRSLLPQSPPPDRRLARLLERGLAPSPADRFASAGEFAETLAGLREQREALRRFPPLDRVAQWSWRHPITALVLGGVLPQFVGSALQISYNAIRIVGTLTPAQVQLFPMIVIVYNLVAYPACLGWLLMRLLRVVRVWRALRRNEPVIDVEVDEARRRALRLPRDTAVVAAIGWFPGAIIFPLALHLGAGPLPWDAWLHFFVSFALAGLIAVTYSFFFVLGVVLRPMYVRFWSNPRGFRERSPIELAMVPDRLRTVNVLAGIVPLAGAMLLVLVGPTGFVGGNYDAFRVLTASLILAGMAGYVAVGKLTRAYLEVVSACTGTRSLRG
jgi:serine/threonine protein kinase